MMWFKAHMPERRRAQWHTLMSKMPRDPQGTYGQKRDSTGRLDPWEENVAWLLKLFDMHHGEAVLMPLDAYDTPCEWKGLSELRSPPPISHGRLRCRRHGPTERRRFGPLACEEQQWLGVRG